MNSLDELKNFLIEAKMSTWPSGGGKVTNPERKDFKEYIYERDPWFYRDSYVGSEKFSGQEVVRYNGKIVWVMSYYGQVIEKFSGKKDLIDSAFEFLKMVLKNIQEDKPFRGPNIFTHESYPNFKYMNEVKGDLREFEGKEIILYKGELFYKAIYFGGIID